ncbi:MAG: PQQ-binding-like beta-propeller repeat protein [Tepidisphaeraceae bacterium]
MRSIRLCAASVLLTSAACLGVIVSPDSQSTGSGFSLPKEDDSFTNSLEDFTRYSEKKQWDAACRAVSKILEQPPKGFVSDEDGVLLPGRQRLRQALLTLPPEGLAAYRLFFDAQAKQQYDKAVAAGADDAATLRKVVDGFLQTSSGALAADRLGDAEFEAGNFAAAEAQWKLILDFLPDSPLPDSRLYAKRGVALSRLGRSKELEQLLAAAESKFAGESVEIGGRSQNLVAFLTDLRNTPATAPSGPAAASELAFTPSTLTEAWQSVFMTDAIATEFSDALQNTGWWRYVDSPATSIPAAGVDDKRAYVNWMGIVFAVDLKTGKLLWRTEKFGRFKGQGMSVIQGGVDATDYALTVANGRVYAVGNVASGYTGNAVIKPLRCFNAETGKALWATLGGPAGQAQPRRTIVGAILGSSNSSQANSGTGGSLATYNFTGTPVVDGDTLYAVAAQQGQSKFELLAIEAESGAKLWSVALGNAIAGENFRGQTQLPRPQLCLDGNALYVLTNNGALLAVDLADKSVRWAIRTEASPVVDRENMIVFSDDVRGEKIEPPGQLVLAGGRLFMKETATRKVFAIDPTIPKLLWKRPLEKEIGIITNRDGRLITTGAAAEAIDADSKRLLWSTPLTAHTGQMTPVFGERRMLVQSSRGIFLIDTETGDTLNTFRTTDKGAIGGNLHLAGDLLVSVSNRAITAYRMGQAPAK